MHEQACFLLFCRLVWFEEDTGRKRSSFFWREVLNKTNIILPTNKEVPRFATKCVLIYQLTYKPSMIRPVNPPKNEGYLLHSNEPGSSSSQSIFSIHLLGGRDTFSTTRHEIHLPAFQSTEASGGESTPKNPSATRPAPLKLAKPGPRLDDPALVLVEAIEDPLVALDVQQVDAQPSGHLTRGVASREGMNRKEMNCQWTPSP